MDFYAFEQNDPLNNVVYIMRDENDLDWEEEPRLIGIYTTPDKALKVMNKAEQRYCIYKIPLDSILNGSEFSSSNELKIRASKFRFMTRRQEANAHPSIIFDRATREEILKAIVNGGAKLERNTAHEIVAKRARENFPDDYYWGVPIEWEFGEMDPEQIHPKPVPLEPEVRLSDLMGGPK